MHKLYDLKSMICEELERQADKELTRDSLEIIDKLAHAGKNITKLIKSSEEEGGMSKAGSYGSYRGSYDGPWSGGANGRETSMTGGMNGRSYARDSMGRYSRGSYAGGYSGAGEEFAEELRKMGQNLPENFRGEILRMADKMEHMQG